MGRRMPEEDARQIRRWKAIRERLSRRDLSSPAQAGQSAGIPNSGLGYRFFDRHAS